MNDSGYLLAKMEGAFQLREGRGMTDRERRFAIASAHDAADECHATCDVSRMKSLLREQPSLLDTVGSLALSMATTYHGTHDAVLFLLERGVRTLYDCETGLAGKGNHEAVSGAFYCGNFRTLRTLFEAGVTDASFANMPWISWPHKTTLLRMSIYRPLEYARFALEHGVDPDEELPFEEESGHTALQNAVAPPMGGAGLPWHNPERWAQGMRFAEFLLSEGAYYDVFSACGRGDLDRLRTLDGRGPEGDRDPGRRRPDPPALGGARPVPRMRALAAGPWRRRERRVALGPHGAAHRRRVGPRRHGLAPRRVRRRPESAGHEGADPPPSRHLPG